LGGCELQEIRKGGFISWLNSTPSLSSGVILRDFSPEGSGVHRQQRWGKRCI
jgi:hypothetical protein